MDPSESHFVAVVVSASVAPTATGGWCHRSRESISGEKSGFQGALPHLPLEESIHVRMDPVTLHLGE